MAEPPDIGVTMYLPPNDAVRVWQEREALSPTVNWSEMMHEAHASAFTVAKIARLDLLRTVRESLDTVIRSGGTFEQWKAGILPELRRQGWWGVVRNPALTGTSDAVIVNDRRLRTIYRTNIRMSIAAGRWRRIQSEKAIFPYLRYRSDHWRRRPRLDHQSWHGLLLRVDDPWWLTHFPPNGWGCNCLVDQVSEREMRKNGWTVGVAPTEPSRAFTTALGDTISVPEGVDPGFGYNPGTAHLRTVADRATHAIAQAAPHDLPAARRTLREIVADPAFEQFAALPSGSIPVAVLSSDHSAEIGATAQAVVMPAPVFNKQRGLSPRSAGHPELTLADYRLIGAAVDAPTVLIRQRGTTLVFFAPRASSGRARWWKVVVRQDANRAMPAVVSFQPADDREVEREARRGAIVVDRRGAPT